MSKKQTRSKNAQSDLRTLYTVPALHTCLENSSAGAFLDFEDGELRLTGPQPVGRRTRQNLREALRTIELAVRPLELTKVHAVLSPTPNSNWALDAARLALLLQSFKTFADEERALLGSEIHLTAGLWLAREPMKIGSGQVDSGYRAGVKLGICGSSDATEEVREAIRRLGFLTTAAWEQMFSMVLIGWVVDSGIRELRFEQRIRIDGEPGFRTLDRHAHKRAEVWIEANRAQSGATAPDGTIH